MNSKRETFLRIWNKESPKSRDSIKQKLINKGIEPTQINCYEYWMGYIRPWKDTRGNVNHLNPYRNEAFMRSIGRNKYGTPFNMERRNKKKKRRFNK